MLKRSSICALVAAAATCAPHGAAAQTYGYTVGATVHTVDSGTPYGEAQSAVVPPGVKPGCPGGRVLVTNDLLRPPQSGTVIGRDLGAPDGPDVPAAFGPVPGSDKLLFGTNDHDIAALSNGDVILEWGVHMRGVLTPKPSWFDQTYHGTFGPGARRGLMVWRSTDCGATFNAVSRIDPGAVGDGSCAFPQPVHPPTVPVTFFNGGSDGQLLRADVRNNILLVAFPCVGFLPATTKPKFTLSASPVNKTLLFRSTDEAASWHLVATVPFAMWRLSVAPLDAGVVALGESAEVLFAHPSGVNYTLDQSVMPVPPPANLGWTGSTVPYANVNANLWASTLVMRCPGSSNAILAFPAMIDPGTPKAAAGYRMFFFDTAAKKYAEAEPIVPLVRAKTSAIMHLVAIDPGHGPLLLYWYDIDGAGQRATIRGRAVIGDRRYSHDFAISRGPRASTRYFSLTTPAYWYGDYLTAGGYGPRVSQFARTSHFYPMWVEPDRTARFNDVAITEATLKGPVLPMRCCAPPPYHEGVRAVRITTRAQNLRLLPVRNLDVKRASVNR